MLNNNELNQIAKFCGDDSIVETITLKEPQVLFYNKKLIVYFAPNGDFTRTKVFEVYNNQNLWLNLLKQKIL